MVGTARPRYHGDQGEAGSHVGEGGGGGGGLESEGEGVPAWDREEAKEVAGLGDGGADGVGIIGVLYTAEVGLFVPVLGTNVVVH